MPEARSVGIGLGSAAILSCLVLASQCEQEGSFESLEIPGIGLNDGDPHVAAGGGPISSDEMTARAPASRDHEDPFVSEDSLIGTVKQGPVWIEIDELLSNHYGERWPEIQELLFSTRTPINLNMMIDIQNLPSQEEALKILEAKAFSDEYREKIIAGVTGCQVEGQPIDSLMTADFIQPLGEEARLQRLDRVETTLAGIGAQYYQTLETAQRAEMECFLLATFSFPKDRDSAPVSSDHPHGNSKSHSLHGWILMISRIEEGQVPLLDELRLRCADLSTERYILERLNPTGHDR